MPPLNSRENGLPPMISDTPRVLILGSFPSRISLEHGFSYANPRNQFWEVMRAILDLPGLPRNLEMPREYPAFLVQRHLAL
jgi:hypoxanthine-DNA glycosylase